MSKPDPAKAAPESAGDAGSPDTRFDANLESAVADAVAVNAALSGTTPAARGAIEPVEGWPMPGEPDTRAAVDPAAGFIAFADGLQTAVSAIAQVAPTLKKRAGAAPAPTAESPAAAPPAPGEFKLVPLAHLVPCETNPRRRRDAAEDAEFNASIAANGILQPLLVRPMSGEQIARLVLSTGVSREMKDRVRDLQAQVFEIVAGHRRYAGAVKAGLAEAPVMIRTLSDVDVARLQLIENLQRADLHPLDEADGYRRMTKDFGVPVEKLAGQINRSKEYVYARLKLADLCREAREAFYAGKLVASTALLIARIPVERLQIKALAEIVRAEGWEPMSQRSAAQHVKNNYMVVLSRAPFDTKATDYYLDKKALQPLPACGACPKRTGAQPELFADVDGPDACTDPTCFAAKRAAAESRVVEKAVAKGQTVITGADARKIRPNQWQRDLCNGYKRPEDEFGKGGTLKAALGVHAPAPVLLQDPFDKQKLIKVYEPTALAEAFKKAGIKASSAGAGNDAHAKKSAAALAQGKIDAEIRFEIYKALRAKMNDAIVACGGLPWIETVREIAMMVAEWTDNGDGVAEMLWARGVMKHGQRGPYDAFEKMAREIKDPAGLFLLMWECTLAPSIDETYHDRKKDPLLQTADRLKLDTIAIATRVKTEAKAREAAAAAAKTEEEKPGRSAPKKAAKKAANAPLKELPGFADGMKLEAAS